jgi:hypothetical protein
MERRRFTSVSSLGFANGSYRRHDHPRALRWSTKVVPAWWDLSEGAVFRRPVERTALLLLYVPGKCIVKLKLRKAPRCSIAKPASDLAGSGPNRAVVKDANPRASLTANTLCSIRMKALRVTWLGFDRIAAQLNAEELKTRTGARWHGLVVNRILTGKGRMAA